MENKEIIEGNGLIVEYMGGMLTLKEAHFNNWMDIEFALIGLEDFLYHEEYSWIMPVVEKILEEKNYNNALILTALAVVILQRYTPTKIIYQQQTPTLY